MIPCVYGYYRLYLLIFTPSIHGHAGDNSRQQSNSVKQCDLTLTGGHFLTYKRHSRTVGKFPYYQVRTNLCKVARLPGTTNVFSREVCSFFHFTKLLWLTLVSSCIVSMGKLFKKFREFQEKKYVFEVMCGLPITSITERNFIFFCNPCNL